MPSPTARRLPRRRPGAATTSASTRRRTAASTSAPRRRRPRVRGDARRPSPTSPSPSAATASGFTVEQKLLVLDVPADHVDALVDGLAALGPRGATRRPSAAARWRAPGWSSASSRSSRPRPAPHDLVGELEDRLPRFYAPADRQRERLPQLLRAHPGRRPRLQGPDRDHARGRAGRGLPGAPRRRRSASTPGSAASCAATRSPRTSCPTTSSGSRAPSRSSATRTRASRTGQPERTRRP